MARLDENYTRYPRAILWLLRGGTIMVGGDEPDSTPRFEVEVSPFYISKTPISNEQYEAYDPEFRRATCSAGDQDTATGVSFADAVGYCAWYARVARKPIRLPTEVEWEYACRAGSDTRYPFGDDPAPADAYLWDAQNSAGRVGGMTAKKPNFFGLHGMLGGVWEWTGSLHLPYPAIEGDGRNDAPAPGKRVLRGGSFRVHRTKMGSAVRRAADPGTHDDDIGFRIVRSL